MAQNWRQAYGYKFYIVPILKSEIDFADLELGGLGSGKFIDDSTPLDNDELVTKTGTGATLEIAVGATTLALDGTDNPVRLLGLTNAVPEEGENEETVNTYDDETQGFEQSVATGKTMEWTIEGASDHDDAAYKLLRLCAKESVREGLMVKYARVGPVGVDEVTYGFGRVTGFSENAPAGGVVTWSGGIKAYGPYEIEFSTGGA